MIVKALCLPFILILKGIIALLPTFDVSTPSLTNTLSLLSKALNFFPIDVWIVAIGSFVFWISVHLIYSLISFILGFVPTINAK